MSGITASHPQDQQPFPQDYLKRPPAKRKTMSSSPMPVAKISKSSRQSLGPRPLLTLQTIVISPVGSENISKFVHAENGITLTSFCDQLRVKHRLSPEVNLIDVHLTLKDMILSINLDDVDRDWDWEALMMYFGKTEGLVKVIVRVN